MLVTHAQSTRRESIIHSLRWQVFWLIPPRRGTFPEFVGETFSRMRSSGQCRRRLLERKLTAAGQLGILTRFPYPTGFRCKVMRLYPNYKEIANIFFITRSPLDYTLMCISLGFPLCFCSFLLHLQGEMNRMRPHCSQKRVKSSVQKNVIIITPISDLG